MGIDSLSLVIFSASRHPVATAGAVTSARYDQGRLTCDSIVTMILSFAVWALFDNVASGMQFELNVPWVSSFGINYHLG